MQLFQTTSFHVSTPEIPQNDLYPKYLVYQIFNLKLDAIRKKP